MNPTSKSNSGTDTYPHANNFDFLRMFFAVLVIWGHSSGLLYHDPWQDNLTRLTLGQLFSGTLGVYSFFVISGFLIAQSWSRSKRLKSYFNKRIRRIYPGFIVASTLCALVTAPLGADSFTKYWAAFSPGRFLLSVLFLRLPDIPPTFEHLIFPLVNGSLWTIEAEFLCYILVASLGILGLLQRRVWLIAFIVGVYLLNRLESHYGFAALSWRPTPYLISLEEWLPNLVFFCAGMFLTIAPPRTLTRPWLVLTALCATLVCARIKHALPSVLPLTLPILLLWLAHARWLRCLTSRMPQGMDLSYGTYLYAFPIQQLLIWFVPFARSTIPLFCSSLALTLPVAWLSWRYVEAPFLHKRVALQST